MTGGSLISSQIITLLLDTWILPGSMSTSDGQATCAGASLKKISVSGEAAGCLKKGRLGTFVFYFCKKKFSPKMHNVFLPTEKKKWKKKKIAAD